MRMLTSVAPSLMVLAGHCLLASQASALLHNDVGQGVAQQSDALGLLSALRGNRTAQNLWTPVQESPHTVQLAKGRGPPLMRIERLQEIERGMSLAKMMKGGVGMETVLRTKLLDSPIFKTKISWECRKAKTKGTRNDCEWRKATALFCHLIPRSSPKLSAIGDLEEASHRLLSQLDTTEASAMLSALQVGSEPANQQATEAGAELFADVNRVVHKTVKNIGDEAFDDMFDRVTNSAKFKIKVRETCRGLEVQRPNCLTDAIGSVFCNTMTQASLSLIEADDLASMMAGKMEMHFDEIKLE